ncbi:unnamed protein product [Rotaria socialis]|uniref:Uncharacterized protein n=1 Tax=Rotaria socialis TaxID=392032 RepID=A0A821PM39_9BILA|nr:unnamed protein product [Rotaria socialis]
MCRDLAMVRRIVLRNGQLVVTSLPAAIVMIMVIIRLELLNVKYFHVLVFMMDTSPCIMVSILFWITPNLRSCLCERFNQLKHWSVTIANRVMRIRGNQTLRVVQHRLPTISNRVNPK